MDDEKISVDYYEVLECNRCASTEELKKNYQRLVLTLHPDKRVENKEGASFLLLQKAWSVLRDPVLRKQYDAELVCKENSDFLIYETINMKDMKFILDECIYVYSCRCGGTYVLEASETQQSTVIIGCDECSFSIKICL
ncbi:unnamed protein product [Diatraea saccharalis]|uniref:J domain-containing protein n=1 Tax=Diatraea saccharalis TaxID=40085 RepID=A0A9N9W7K7_9NEOP|nr:unnamed protein product [Diatraea saccharalis]